MTVSSTTSKVIYTGNGSASVFAYPFKIYEDADLVVTKVTISTEAETDLTLTTDYTVSGAGEDGGGNVTLVAGALSALYKLVIRRVLDLKQETDYVENDPFPAETHEEVADRVVMIAQQLQEQVDRAVLSGVASESTTSLIDLIEAATASAADSAADAATAQAAAEVAQAGAESAEDTAVQAAQDAAAYAASLSAFPTFKANRGAVNQTISDNVWTKLQMNNEVFDSNGNYDPVTNYRFTVAVAGTYLLMAQVYTSIINSAQEWAVGIYKNGSLLAQSSESKSQETTTVYFSPRTSIVDVAVAGDYYEMFVFQTNPTATARQIGGYAAANFFCGSRLNSPDAPITFRNFTFTATAGQSLFTPTEAPSTIVMAFVNGTPLNIAAGDVYILGLDIKTSSGLDAGDILHGTYV